MGQALRLTLIGVAGGLVAASALARVPESFLFKVGATDPATFAGTAALFVLVLSWQRSSQPGAQHASDEGPAGMTCA